MNSATFLRGCAIFAFMVSMMFIGFGITAYHHTHDPDTYKLYKNTSCLITDHKRVTEEKRVCYGAGQRTGCTSLDVTYDKLFLSYIIWNGTLVNGTRYIEFSTERDYSKEIGSHHKCLYNPERVTDVVLKLPDGTGITFAYVCFGIGFGILILAGVLFLASRSIKSENGI
ncbi:unnamed protein product [Adineta steineri]|uniref:Uncharacterized protein n=1 Tax=Adineta steineri TaxID=433720 RepID=A0A815P5I4_9BILA|nr:unnamed protein product [Adineta steineri]CAF1628782.1 unnamed protein product [Adineta steineri]